VSSTALQPSRMCLACCFVLCLQPRTRLRVVGVPLEGLAVLLRAGQQVLLCGVGVGSPHMARQVRQRDAPVVQRRVAAAPQRARLLVALARLYAGEGSVPQVGKANGPVVQCCMAAPAQRARRARLHSFRHSIRHCGLQSPLKVQRAGWQPSPPQGLVTDIGNVTAVQRRMDALAQRPPPCTARQHANPSQGVSCARDPWSLLAGVRMKMHQLYTSVVTTPLQRSTHAASDAYAWCTAAVRHCGAAAQPAAVRVCQTCSRQAGRQ